MRVLFWGTPEFAAPSLRALLGEGFDVVGVITQPDKPQGRSRSRVVAPPIKEIAEQEGLAVLQPERPRGPEFLDQLRALDPQISVVVAYGHVLVPEVIDLPARGTLNVHASLLPALRGAAPISAAIRLGLVETGVSVMRIVPALDAGPVLMQIPTSVAADETGGELQLRLSELGAQALIEAMALVEMGVASEVPQDDALATYAPKVDRQATRVDFSSPAVVVARHIRAYDPRPGAFTTAPSGEVKLFGAQVANSPPAPGAPHAPGDVLDAAPGELHVACGEGTVRVLQVQPAGRALMSAGEWVRGRGIAPGDRLGT